MRSYIRRFGLFIACLVLTNGTATWGGYYLVKDVSFPGFPNSPDLTDVNGTLFFIAYDDMGVRRLWKSDGTDEGTVVVDDEARSPSGLTKVNGTLFFAAYALSSFDVELWKSDGTDEGTVLVKDIRTDFPYNGSNPTELTDVNGTLFFTADDGIHSRELWKSDGTAAGTVLVKDIRPSELPLGPYYPTELTAVNGMLFFTADDGSNGDELWKSDGTETGTTLVKDVDPSIGPGAPGDLVNVNGTLFFAAYNQTYGRELWKSDGTAAGTVMVKDIRLGLGNSSNPTGLTHVNGTLYFAAEDGTNGIELWKSDGTAAGTVMVKNINPQFCSAPQKLTAVRDVVFFSADDGTTGREPWASDGTSGGTVLIQDINLGSASSEPELFTSIGHELYFCTYGGGVAQSKFWSCINGTPSGLENVATLNSFGCPGYAAASRNKLFITFNGLSAVPIQKFADLSPFGGDGVVDLDDLILMLNAIAGQTP